MKLNWRPQILSAIAILGIVAILGMYQGFNEIATGAVAGIIALGMKLLENNEGG